MSSLTEFTGSIPALYDQNLGPLLFEPYALDLYERLKGKKYNRILELACGTGRVTRHLAELTKDEGELYATDLNPDMLQVAQQKTDNGLIHWSVVNAEDIPFEAGFFDLVVCQFGVMFFKDKHRAFSEVHRILKTGGTFLFNTWDHFDYNAAARISQQVLQEVLTDNPPDFLEKGPYSFFDPNLIREMLAAAGFMAVEIDVVAKTGMLQTADQVAIGIVDGSPLTSYLNERYAPKEEIKSKITAFVTAEYKNSQLPMQALVCTAKK
jgi:ubiquinone/menaquinone biosynthesis C-methylase UbiE